MGPLSSSSLQASVPKTKLNSSKKIWFSKSYIFSPFLILKLACSSQNLRWLRWKFTVSSCVACFDFIFRTHDFIVNQPFDLVWLPINSVLMKGCIYRCTLDHMSSAIDGVLFRVSPKVVSPIHITQSN